MMVLYANRDAAHGISPHQCPIRVGTVMRVVAETSAEMYIIVNSWWPLLKPSKHHGKVNIFGTWIPCLQPVNADEATEKATKKHKAASKASSCIMVKMSDVLLWPVVLDKGADGFDQGGRLPFTALHVVKIKYDIDVAHPMYTFAKRGKRFYDEVVRAVADKLRHAS